LQAFCCSRRGSASGTARPKRVELAWSSSYDDDLNLRQAVPVALVGGFLALAFVLMVRDATAGGDWPGWDEASVVAAFALGVPVVVAAALREKSRRVAAVTAAVWCWGALLFLLWLAASSD
jgi:hypothetical protein